MEITKEEEKTIFIKVRERIGALFGKLKEKFIGIAQTIIKTAKDDPRRIIHSLKMALALTLVSLVYYVRPLYNGFGVSGTWAVITVVFVFEFSVGATIGKGLNRGFATLMAVALAVGAKRLAVLFGEKAEPFVLGFFAFLLASLSTFTRFIPGIKRRYDYGVLIFLLTFSLVEISGYRADIITMASQRLVTILVGVASCMIVSLFIFPVWAGEDLHNLIAENIEKLAKFLEGFEEEYSKALLPENTVDATVISNKDAKQSFYQIHKSVLSSKNNEEIMANFARWEPSHGRFKLRYSWKQYLKIGALARQCAYQIEALCVHNISDVKVSLEFRRKIQDSCKKMSIESSKALRAMASSMKTMNDSNPVDIIHVEKAKEAAIELEIILKTTSYDPKDLIVLVHDVTAASILVNITDSVEKISKAVHELAKLASFKPVVGWRSVSSETKASSLALHRGVVNPVSSEGEGEKDGKEVENHVAVVIDNQPSVGSPPIVIGGIDKIIQQ